MAENAIPKINPDQRIIRAVDKHLGLDCAWIVAVALATLRDLYANNPDYIAREYGQKTVTLLRDGY